LQLLKSAKNINMITTTTTTTTTTPAPSSFELIANTIACCLSLRNKAVDAKKAILSAIETAIETYGAEEAAKEVRALLIGKHGLDKRIVSKALLEFGLRTRAAKKEDEGDAEDLASAIELLIAQAEELVGDKAKVALRRAYLSLQGKENA
jgi:hypothetical protein